MNNTWSSNYDFNKTQSGYTIDTRLSIFPEQTLNTHDIHFKNQTCLNGITFSYIKDLNNIYEKTLLTGNGRSINNMYTEYNMINKYLKNLYEIDIATDEQIDLTRNYFKIDNIVLKDNHLILLFDQENKINNDIYIVKNNILMKTDILSSREKANKAKFQIKLGTYKEKQFFLLNESINFPISEEKKEFKLYHSYLLKNEIQYDINAIDPKIIFSNYDVARHLQDNSKVMSNIIFDIPTNYIMIRLVFNTSTIFELKSKSGYTFNADIYWGDDYITHISTTGKTQHNYNAGEYILIIDGKFPALDFENDQYIREIIEWGKPNNLKYINFKNSNLKKISEKEKKLTNVFSFNESFYGCDLREIPINLFVGNTVTEFTSTFENCKKLKKIDNIFYDNINITSLNSTFKNCNISDISEDIFKTNTNLVSLTSTFEKNNITIIPKDIFKYNINIKVFNATFKSNHINTIPYKLFKYNSLVTSFESVFEQNDLNTVSDIFKNNPLVTTFKSTFKNNHIMNIASNIFYNNSSVTSFESTFEYNEMIDFSPQIFLNNILVTTFNSTFKNNHIMYINTTELFNITHDTSFDWTFANNYDLIHSEAFIIDSSFTVGPSGLSFIGTFSNCYNLNTYVPFLNNSGEPNVFSNFTECFFKCFSMFGTAQELYYKNNVGGGPLIGKSCFFGCTNLTNYNVIPDEWKK